MNTYFETPEDAAYGLKMDITEFLDEWFYHHEICGEQRTYIWRYVVNDGWGFFHDELLDYFRKCPDRYTVHDDDSIECSM